MSKTVSIKNYEALTEDMRVVYEEMRAGKIGQNEVKALANITGKLIGLSKVKIEYNKMVGNTDEKIKFLENE